LGNAALGHFVRILCGCVPGPATSAAGFVRWRCACVSVGMEEGARGR
jgi:hypothetical protein